MKPYIVCHMMASVDGRIDCDMTAQIGADGYYAALSELKVDTTIEGRVTGLMHYAEKTPFRAKNPAPIGKTAFFKARESKEHAVIADTRGTLMWPESDTPDRVCLISESAPLEYAEYLESRGISYIAAGKDRIDLEKAVEILAREFGSRRIGVVGGGHINGAFLKAGLLDEVSMVYGAAIDGREGFAAAFDGIEKDHARPFMLRLESVKRMSDDSVWIRYSL